LQTSLFQNNNLFFADMNQYKLYIKKMELFLEVRIDYGELLRFYALLYILVSTKKELDILTLFYDL
jgi:hypothetical protein